MRRVSTDDYVRTTVGPERWQNWAQNQTFQAETALADSETGIQQIVREIAEAGGGVRVAGSGHSFTPIVEPSTTLLRLTGPRGVISADRGSKVAEMWAHTPLREIGPELWNHGLSLRNQGDTDAQTIAGATATGTKGSGRSLSSLSSEVRSVTLIDGCGELRRIEADDAQPEELLAAQVSLGLLGIVSRVGLKTDTAYGLEEHNSIDPLSTVLETLEADSRDVRHYSFCWCPSDETAARFALPPTPADSCWVKRLTTTAADHPALTSGTGVSGEPGRRIGRSYLIYPDWADQDPEHVELEYMIPADRWTEAFSALRSLMLRDFPEEISMVQVRWQAADSAYLSAQHDTNTVSLALVSDREGNYDTFLHAVHDTLMPYGPRPHWGKMHYFSPAEIAEAFPALGEFRAVREKFDPSGVFSNPSLTTLLDLQSA
ncbi:D-arabinono-1,4-lactone oxidase [Subtercola sp. YIM 133946]|uniref:D-arabinono-1,4-lactone oxidase n=1 Tax=Subtercola sp. YIM 133946 TaxID=3118909 RepID=UPI002F9498A0